jgi:hypothetical protein
VSDQRHVIELLEEAHPAEETLDKKVATERLADAQRAQRDCAVRKAALVEALQVQMSASDGLQMTLPQRIANKERLRVRCVL